MEKPDHGDDDDRAEDADAKRGLPRALELAAVLDAIRALRRDDRIDDALDVIDHGAEISTGDVRLDDGDPLVLLAVDPSWAVVPHDARHLAKRHLPAVGPKNRHALESRGVRRAFVREANHEIVEDVPLEDPADGMAS